MEGLHSIQSAYPPRYPAIPIFETPFLVCFWHLHTLGWFHYWKCNRTYWNISNQVCRPSGTVYDLNCCTFNVHCLTHLAKCVKNCGPLWATSAFEFEAHNHMLLKMFNGTQYANQQIANTFLLKKAILLLTMQYTGESTSVSGKVELQQKVYHCK